MHMEYEQSRVAISVLKEKVSSVDLRHKYDTWVLGGRLKLSAVGIL